jgi:hypothetical protein
LNAYISLLVRTFFLPNEVLHHLNQKWSYVKLIICMISTWVSNYIYAQLVEFVNIYLKIFLFHFVNQPLQNVLLMPGMVSISIVNTLFYLEIRDDMACLVFEMWICLSCLKIHSTLWCDKTELSPFWHVVVLYNILRVLH